MWCHAANGTVYGDNVSTHADEPSTSRHKRPRPSETKGSSEDESDTCSSGSDSE